MKSTILILACAALTCTAVFSCKKNDAGKSANTVSKKVYIAGYEESSSGDGIGRYWIDSSSFTLSSLPDYIELRDIDVSGTDVYTMGEVELQAGGAKTVIWKNGNPIYNIAETLFKPEEMNVNGNDVYLVGSIQGNTAPYIQPAYWKNGTITTLSQTSNYAMATSIHINGSDIYAAGWDLTANNSQYLSKYWKNGVAQTIADCPNINDITTNGSDVYVTGYDVNYKPAYWKNGTKVALPIAANANGQAIKIQVSEGNVYVCGSEEINGQPEKAMLWKNAVQQTLDGTSNAYTSANDMDIDGSNVYLCGAHYQPNSLYRAAYWKNGTLHFLNNTANIDYSEATAIRVK